MLRLFEAFGIELEYMLVDGTSLGVAPEADWLLAEAAGEITGEYVSGELAWNNELALHVIEFKVNQPIPQLSGLADLFQADIRKANGLLDRRGLRLMPSGMHPWMDPLTELRTWPHDDREIYEAFDRIFSCKGHGWANLQSMHINLPFADDGEFRRLHSAIRFLMPIMPGLTASSPAMDGRLTGMADNRLAAYRNNCIRVPSVTGSIIPEPVASIAEYEKEILQRIYSDMAPLDPQGVLAEEWVNARGAIARFDRMAIEIRVLDMQECPAMDIAFASLLVQTLRSLCSETWTDLESLAGWRTEDLARFLDATIVKAERTEIHDGRYLRALGYRGSSVTVGRLWGHLADRAASAAALDPQTERLLEGYLSEGTLATRLVARLPAEPGRGDFEPVYHELCDRLAEGRPFLRGA